MMNRIIAFFLLAGIIVAAVGMSLLAYPKLPDRMACHWGPGGEPDNWLDKSIGVWIMPGTAAVLSAFFFVVLLIDPWRRNIEKFLSYYAGFVIIMNFFLLAVHGWMLLWNIGIQIPANVFIPLGMACLIFYLGIVTSRVKPNWFIGIRTPWTLSNEIVWQKTHKLGGVLFRIAAIIMLIGAVFPKYAIVFVLAPIFSVAVITVLYSLWLGVGGKRPDKKYLSMFFIILLLACVGAVLIPAIHSTFFSTPAFADVVEPLLNAKTVSFHSSGTMQMGDKEVSQTAMVCTYQIPSRMRIEMLEDNMTVIGDIQSNKMLMLMPDNKTAMMIEIPLPTDVQTNPENFYTCYFDMRERICQAKENGTAELLPETVINSRKVIGYRIRETHNDTDSDTTLWIDKKTGRLVQTQSNITIGSVKLFDKETDFEFDKKLPPDFFSIEVPDGYTLVQMPVDLASHIKIPDEQALIDMFRVWAEYTDGHFPPDLTLDSITNLVTQPMEDLKVRITEGSLADLPDPNDFDDLLDLQLNQTTKMAAGIIFAQMLPEGSDWHYVGKDAIFGDAQTPIFWYCPKNASTYRVIYADLSVKDVPVNQLPTISN